MNLIERFKNLTVANQANVIFGSIVTIATAGNLFVGIIQYNTAKKNAESSSEQTKQLISAANKNADAAKSFSDSASAINDGISSAVGKLPAQAEKMDAARIAAEQQSRQSLDATIRNSHTDQRAWVGSGDTTFTINESAPVVVHTLGRNVGKSPAVDVSSEISWVVKPTKMGPLKRENIVYGQWTKKLSNGTVFPGQNFGIDFIEREIIPNQSSIVNDLKNESSVFYIYGFIDYKDVFGVSHWTTFCYQTSREMKGVGTCAIYNDSDSDTNADKNYQ